MRSIVQKNNDECFMCGRSYWLEEHHIFGAANRKHSTKYGLVVNLCHWCHNEPPDGVHHNKENRERLMQAGQRAFEETHTREEFMAIFGRNWLEE